ncbi:MAG: hypothetical protein ABI690_13420 [Chloroflexota bacterium]
MSQKIISTFDASDKPKEKCPRCGSRHLQTRLDAAGNWIRKCHDCRKAWIVVPPQEFQGELMTCAMCGKEQQSQPDQNSDWRLLEVNGQKHYVCTDHFPPDGSSKEAFADAYEKILRHIGFNKEQ